MAHFWILLEGIGTNGSTETPADEGAGRRKGSAPVGDAWLFDATVSKGIPTNLRYAWLKFRVMPVSQPNMIYLSRKQ